jgi:hypothetical protein
MAFSSKVILDSISTNGVRLTTMEVTFPRIILAEFNTHRTFSRNSASSRAIPVERRIASLEADPFIPESFGKNMKGMQAHEQLDDEASAKARATWINATNDAIRSAKYLAKLGVHKQLANRLIEPFCWHTVICTATDWSNFFALRTDADAQPEIRTIATMMRASYETSRPQFLMRGEWHTPYVTDKQQLRAAGHSLSNVLSISAGRCARVSYLTHDGKRDPTADIELADMLRVKGHLSPFEHVACPLETKERCGNLRGWKQLRKFIINEDDFSKHGAA